jgi:hypothetical protein
VARQASEFASLPQGTQPWYGDGLGISRCNCPLIEREDQFQIVNNWTKTLGNHSIKIGADLRYGRNLRVPSDTDRDGVLQFNAGPTSDAGASGTGFWLRDRCTGRRNQHQPLRLHLHQRQGIPEAHLLLRFRIRGAHQQADPNLGIRWEGYYPEAVNGAGNGSLLSLNDGYLHVAGVGSVPTDMGWDLDEKKMFEPRIGLAYQLNPKTVVRGGYGRSFDIGVFGSVFGHVVTQNLPVLANQSINGSGTGNAFCLGLRNRQPRLHTACVTQPSVGGPAQFVPPAVPASGLLPNPGYNVNSKARPNPMQFPTLDAWNLSVQRALTPTLSLTVAYVGNKGTHTLSDGDGNNTQPNDRASPITGTTKTPTSTLCRLR